MLLPGSLQCGTKDWTSWTFPKMGETIDLGIGARMEVRATSTLEAGKQIAQGIAITLNWLRTTPR